MGPNDPSQRRRPRGPIDCNPAAASPDPIKWDSPASPLEPCGGGQRMLRHHNLETDTLIGSRKHCGQYAASIVSSAWRSVLPATRNFPTHGIEISPDVSTRSRISGHSRLVTTIIK